MVSTKSERFVRRGTNTFLQTDCGRRGEIYQYEMAQHRQKYWSLNVEFTRFRPHRRVGNSLRWREKGVKGPQPETKCETRRRRWDGSHWRSGWEHSSVVAHRLSSSARQLRKRVGVLRMRRCQLSRVEGHGRPCTEAAGRVILGASLMDASDWRMDIEELVRGFARDANEQFWTVFGSIMQIKTTTRHSTSSLSVK